MQREFGRTLATAPRWNPVVGTGRQVSVSIVEANWVRGRDGRRRLGNILLMLSWEQPGSGRACLFPQGPEVQAELQTPYHFRPPLLKGSSL